MKLKDYPTLTVIMRGYTYRQAMTIIELLSHYNHQLAVEVTTNNPDHLKIIHDGSKQCGSKVDIGVGTVLTTTQAQDAVSAGAKFMLGPSEFNDSIFKVAKDANILTVPGTMTPSEVYRMYIKGADIIKIFPAISTGASIFKQVQGPLGKLPLMAVGGVNIENAADFLKNGASYLGIGSNFFNKQDVKNLNKSGLQNSIESFLSIVSTVE